MRSAVSLIEVLGSARCGTLLMHACFSSSACHFNPGLNRTNAQVQLRSFLLIPFFLSFFGSRDQLFGSGKVNLSIAVPIIRFLEISLSSYQCSDQPDKFQIYQFPPKDTYLDKFLNYRLEILNCGEHERINSH